jgi:hypothetical protein
MQRTARFVNLTQAEHRSKAGAGSFGCQRPSRGKLRGWLEDPRDDQNEDEIATPIAALGSENAVKTDLLCTTEHRGNMTVRQRTGNGESVAIGSNDRAAFEDSPQTFDMGRRQSERLHNVRLHTLPFSW